MTTFTRIRDGEVPVIEVDVEKRLSAIDPMTYGGFTEHMGRCIYGGIYDPGSPLADAHGFRTDVLAALRELEIPVVRYPGGNFIATYHWEDGVGPRDQRPSRPELAWNGVETNQFGTDEFMLWLDTLSEGRAQRVEPYLCLNMGTGTLTEALAWVEYCNGTKDTYYANLRRRNGHPEPYNVKYWALGNEVWGPWQVEQMTKEAYATKAAQWAKALKLLDPSLCLILCGESGVSSWDWHVLQECVHLVDMHSIHMYTSADDHVRNATAPLSAERAIEVAAGLVDLARIERGVNPTTPKPKICFDEWNVWDMARAPGDRGAEELYTLSDALAVAVWLNVLVRQSAHIGMANIAQSVNVISPLMTTPRGLVRQTTWWPLLLFSRFMRGTTVATHVRCASYDGPTQPAWLQGTLRDGAPWLDVSACVDGEGMANMVVVNLSESEDVRVDVKGVGGPGPVTVYMVSGESVTSKNVEGREEVDLKEVRWVGDKGKEKAKEGEEEEEEGDGLVVFPKHSMMLLRWKVA